jgi:hypothetical protein
MVGHIVIRTPKRNVQKEITDLYRIGQYKCLVCTFKCNEMLLILLIIIIIVGIQPLGRSGQRPELSQATGMALLRRILGKFLGVVCHCFSRV